jgi:hypothetical protein
MDLFYGYSLFRLITEQIDDDQIPDRIGATIAKLARSGVPNTVRTEYQRRSGALSRTANSQRSTANG